MAALIGHTGVIGVLLILVSASYTTDIPYCSIIFGNPDAQDCYDLVWNQGVLRQDGYTRFFANRGTPRPPFLPGGAWSRKVNLPVLRENSMLASITHHGNAD